MLLTISGDIGSGKSTVAHLLSARLGYAYVSGGDIFRQEAKKRGMTLVEFGTLAERDDSIDRELDRILLQELGTKKNVIVDSRLSGWLCFMNGIYAIKVFVTAPFEIRVRRVMYRENQPEEQVREEIINREESEKKRYMSYYDIDYARKDIYDLIVDSGSKSAEEIADELYDRVLAVSGK
ncbi:MAG: AAA family ATPase [Thermoplasmataceae archaeon]